MKHCALRKIVRRIRQRGEGGRIKRPPFFSVKNYKCEKLQEKRYKCEKLQEKRYKCEKITGNSFGGEGDDYFARYYKCLFLKDKFL